MTTVGPKLDWRFVVCTLGMCVGGGMLSTPANASCGDYVMIGGHGGHSGAGAHDGSTDGLRSEAHAVTSRARLPCHGPECSRRPATPEKQPLTLLSAGVQHWGWSSPSVLVAPPRPARYDLIPPSYRELLYSGSVFRPPRPLD